VRFWNERQNLSFPTYIQWELGEFLLKFKWRELSHSISQLDTLTKSYDEKLMKFSKTSKKEVAVLEELKLSSYIEAHTRLS